MRTAEITAEPEPGTADPAVRLIPIQISCRGLAVWELAWARRTRDLLRC